MNIIVCMWKTKDQVLTIAIVNSNYTYVYVKMHIISSVNVGFGGMIMSSTWHKKRVVKVGEWFALWPLMGVQ